jgi:hypothetical protein
MTRRARRWDDLPQAQSPSTSDPSLRTKTWRDREYKAGRPSGLLDFYRVHSVCIPCQGSGINRAPVEWVGEDPLFKPCHVCLGSGRFKIS